ncbi:MAG: DoxX family protein [Thermocrispum sp.]
MSTIGDQGDVNIEPFNAMTDVSMLVHLAGRQRADRLRTWPVALRCGLAAMFVLTGVAHFVGMRAELVAMVPPALPAPKLLITVTGVLELAGAAGLFWSRTRPWAAAGLAALLLAMFPANVYAALNGIGGETVDGLPLRSALQVVFLAAAVAVLLADLRQRRTRASQQAQTVTTAQTARAASASQ